MAGRPLLVLGAAPGVVALAVGAVLAVQGEAHAATVVVSSLIVAAGLLLDVDLPWGGRVPLGYAVLVAVAVLLAPLETVGVAALGLAVAAPLRPRRSELLVVAAAAVAASAAAFAFEAVAGSAAGSADVRVLLEVAVVGGAFLAVDLLARRRRLDHVAPLYVTLLCAAALLAVAYEQRAALALVAAVPLLVTRYSFGRFTRARQTYAQTTRALSLLPEVAGLTPLGHGERTAVYAAALADALGLDGPAADRIATAARLHHIGHISLHEPEERDGPVDTSELGRVSAELLRETGFLADVAELVEQVQVDEAALSLEAAIIRVSSSLDDLVGEDDPAGDPFAHLLLRHREGLDRTAAIALLRLHDERPAIVEEARAASRMLALVAGAAGGGHDPHHPETHDCR